MSCSTSVAPDVVGAISLSPWANFDKVWTAMMGYQASEFEFVMGKTRFSTLSEVGSICVVYLVLVLGGRHIMRDQPAFELNTVLRIHNFFLTVVSGSLLVLFIEQIVPNLWKHGLYNNICSSAGLSQPLVTLYYVNYLTKFYELLDTVLLVLRKKPLTFLHCYHHSATALLCWTQIAGGTSMSWLAISLNLFVHVVMYWYYFQSARGIKPAWKEWITRFQLAQFLIDLSFVYYGAYNYLAHLRWPNLPHHGTCEGAHWAAITGDLIILSYLVLFIYFYIATYRKKSYKKAAAIGTMSVILWLNTSILFYYLYIEHVAT